MACSHGQDSDKMIWIRSQPTWVLVLGLHIHIAVTQKRVKPAPPKPYLALLLRSMLCSLC